MKRLLEICIDTVESGITAERAGADRVELCDNLLEGGTTPGAGTIRVAVRELSIPVFVMIRPRGGDFLYSGLEYRIMKEEIAIARDEGAAGIVLGMLTPDGSVDIARTRELVELAAPLPVTFHRAFDMTPDPFRALGEVIQTGAARLLTSGQKSYVYESTSLVRELIKEAGSRIIIMPGSGINENNIASVMHATGATEVHLTGRKSIKSRMRFRRDELLMTASAAIPHYSVKVADENRIRRIREIIDTFE